MTFFQVFTVISLGLLTGSSPSALAQEGAETWVRTATAGVTDYLILHSDERGWKLDLVREQKDRLPEPIWQRSFSNHGSAIQFANSLSRKQGYITALQNFFQSGVVATEIQDVPLWKVTKSWSMEWERKFADWVRANVGPDFFVKNNIATDCADVAFAIRWIFARIHGLPAANSIAGSRALFTHQSMKREWLLLPTANDWREDMRFQAALKYLFNVSYTHTLLADSYPIEISPEHLYEGTHHLKLTSDSGHTMLVYKRDISDNSLNPLEILYSDVPQVVRPMYYHGFWESDQPLAGKGGLMRFRWPKLFKGRWDLTPQEAHPGYSLMQYTTEFMGNKNHYGEAVVIRLNPRLDYKSRLIDGIKTLKEQVTSRQATVEQGYAICQVQNCDEGTDQYEAWSTPSRDARLGKLIEQIHDLLDTLESEIPGIGEIWRTALSEPAFSIDGVSYPLKSVVQVWDAGTYSYDPRDPIPARWGLSK